MTVVLGLLMKANAESASLFGIEGPACPSRLVLPEHGCPGCGLTRAVVLGLHGDASESVGVHPAGLLVIVLAIAGAILHGDVIRRKRLPSFHAKALAIGRYLFVFGIVGTWALNALARILTS